MRDSTVCKKGCAAEQNIFLGWENFVQSKTGKIAQFYVLNINSCSMVIVAKIFLHESKLFEGKQRKKE